MKKRTEVDVKPDTWKRILLKILLRSTSSLVAVLVLVISAGLALFYSIEPYVNTATLKDLVAPVAALLILIGAIITGLLSYLGTPDRVKRTAEYSMLLENRLQDFKYYADKLKQEVRSELQSGQLDAISQEKLIEDLKADWREIASSELLRETIDRLKNATQNNERERVTRAEFDDTTSRLFSAIGEINRRANVNLVFGIVMSLIGIGILGYTLTIPPHVESTFEFLKVYIPRVTLVLLVELFAYFFLNLYKASLSETRYYHNEITNVAARRTALLATLRGEDKSNLNQVVTDLLKTERNGILTKTQTTVELAKAKLEADNSKDIASMLSKLVESLAKRGSE